MMRTAVFLALLIAACCYAVRRGGAPERIVAFAFLAAYVLTIAVRSSRPERYFDIETGVFIVDVLLFFIVLAVMLTANRVWPIWMTVLMMMAVGGHIAKLLDPAVIRTVYQIMLSFWGWPAVVLLILATWRHQRRVALNGADASWRRSLRAAPRPILRPPQAG